MPTVEPLGADQRQALLGRVARVLDDHRDDDLLADGEAVEVVGLDDDRILQVRLHGACASCHSMTYAMTVAVERIIRAEVPEIRFVEAVP